MMIYADLNFKIKKRSKRLFQNGKNKTKIKEK
jgi:hypothetical protein